MKEKIKERLELAYPDMEYNNDNFQKMRDGVQKHFIEKMARQKLFKVDCDVEELWQIYLESIPDEIFKTNHYHDCSACHKWFRKAANIVAITTDNVMITLWDGETLPQYHEAFFNLKKKVHEHTVKESFYSSKEEIGIQTTFQEDEDGSVIRNDHFFLELPNSVIRNGVKVGQSKDADSVNRQVFESSLKSISISALNDVIELIEDNNLYRGSQWLNQLKKFRSLKSSMPNQDDANVSASNDNVLNNWYWVKSREAGPVVSKIKNHSIGVLLTDITDGVDLEVALKRYEEIVAPSNYQRPKEIFTKSMLEEAKETIEELGYADSLQRRYAVMSDVSVNDVIYANRNVKHELKDSDDFFGALEEQAIVKPVNTEYYDEVELDFFLEDVVPNAENISLYTDVSLINNFVSLIAPKNKEAPTMFKWDNGFSWAYNNNVADSMKQQVKAMGGDVDVDLRFSIRWNHLGEWDKSDLDAHCIQPGPETQAIREIFFNQKRSRVGTDGYLDVDIIDPNKDVPAVENIRFKDKNLLRNGDYEFFVKQFSARSGNSGFDAEIEFDGQIYYFTYYQPIRHGEEVPVAIVNYNDGEFNIQPQLDESHTSLSHWNVKMHEFIPVNLICCSPNYWGENNIGNEHVFFFLKDCINDSRPNAWFNEFLDTELRQHRRVMEALGRAAKVEDSENQLSGIGVSVTKKTQILFKVTKDGEDKIYKVII